MYNFIEKTENFLSATISWFMCGFNIKAAILFNKRRAHYTKSGLAKKSMTNINDANAYADDYSSKTGHKYVGYKCPFCDNYHIGPSK